MSRGSNHSAIIGAVLALGLAGCAAPYDDTYYEAPYYGDYSGGVYPYPLFSIFRHDHDHWHDKRQNHKHHWRESDHRQLAGHNGHRRRHSQFHRGDFRDGDGEFRRRMRDQSGALLEEHQRRDRQERIREELRDTGDVAALRRQDAATLAVEPTVRRRLADTDAAARRSDRSTQAERQAQKEAAEARRELLARQAEREGLPLVPPPGGGAQRNR